MSLVTRWFSKSGSENYEEVLSALAADVARRQTRLAEIRLRERRTTLQFTLGTLSLWISFVYLWYARMLPATWHDSLLAKVAVLVGPVIILFARRMMQIWYSWKGGREEKTLRVVTQKQRAKVEEIKKKTNYDSTRSLLEKYADPGTPMRRLQPSQPRTPLPITQQAHLQTPIAQQRNLPLQLSPTPQPIQPTRKQWYDKLADAILGDEESSMSVAASRYALICQKCFSHNGLVKESVWEDTQYVCPKCGYLNPSARSKRLGLQRTPSPPANMDTDPPQPASMEGVESTAPSADMVPEKKEGLRSREMAGRTRGDAMQAEHSTS
ncbi:hypothetical protein DEU56DRAFT_894853 [Suillus clintonianus]|uniref:uncharacterized protein n=1 Tax=Suillus clintonianus TaxID=1904413 RepID=UPI001B86D605|nr:uncharacterized protein DEU56DRAFT_894853 [Suillus clintonianus]KAG2120374.1 hypothetical protein DEU56DRAFT_894853 [Suillus clintonianus]